MVEIITCPIDKKVLIGSPCPLLENPVIFPAFPQANRRRKNGSGTLITHGK
jgi:hypothetical protein